MIGELLRNQIKLQPVENEHTHRNIAQYHDDLCLLWGTLERISQQGSADSEDCAYKRADQVAIRKIGVPVLSIRYKVNMPCKRA